MPREILVHPLLDPLLRHAAERGDRIAVRDAQAALTFAEFAGAAAGLAGLLDARSDRPRIGILAPTSSVSAVATYACWYAG
ncbi:MAG: hypothetical protein AB1716_01360, partial [Planctomycetota bacterium]